MLKYHDFCGDALGTLKIWDSIPGAHITQLVAEEEIWGVALCGAGRRIALGVEDGTSRVVDSVTTGVLSMMPKQMSGRYGVRLSVRMA